jgi:ATP synthase protein I
VTSKRPTSAKARDDAPKGIVGRQVDLYRGLAGVGTLGLEIAIGIGLGLIAGRWADARWGTSPFLSLAGLGVGLIVAVKAVLRVMKILRETAAREEREQGNPAPLYESEAERTERAARGASGDDDPVVERLPFTSGTPPKEP